MHEKGVYSNHRKKPRKRGKHYERVHRIYKKRDKRDHETRGRRLKKLNQMTADYLDGLDLSEREREIICDTDFNCMAICYGGMFTDEEVEECIKNEYGEED